MDQNQNDNLFDNNQPQQPSEPTQIGGGARIYQTPPGGAPGEPVYTPPPVYTPAPPPKKNNTIWIVVIVVVLLLCCCCLIGVGGWLWTNGDQLLSDMDLSLLPMLNLLA